MIKKFLISLAIGASFCTNVLAQQKSPENKKMDWFEDAKLGIFVHWGIYSVDGISESWAFFNNYINHTNYMKQLNGFTAANYNAQEWVNLIEQSGAKYTVITSKHHDGVSLWDSKATQAITTKTHSAAKKDVLTPFMQALEKTSLKKGIYFSLPDWSHPLYDINAKTKKRYAIEKEPQRWDSFVTYYQQQLKELSTQFKPDLLWFDGDWEHTDTAWRSQETQRLLQSYNPNIIINSRLNHYGDYETPEQGVPVLRPKSKYWELCYTMNDSWGFQHFDKHYKTPNMIIRTLADCISMGGNLLLDIGPQEDGSIPAPQREILKALGTWTAKHAQAVYGTRAGIPFSNFQGKSALSKDHKTLFLYLEEQKESVELAGLKSKIKDITVVGAPRAKLSYKNIGYEKIQIDLAKASFDPNVTVIAVTLEEPIQYNKNVKPTAEKLENVLNANAADTQIHLRNLVANLHAGSNLLVNSGLTSDGLNLKSPLANAKNTTIKEWISKHAEALDATTAGLPDGHYTGHSALSADRQTLYLFVEGQPTGDLALKGLKNNIARIRIVGEGSMLQHQLFNKLYWSPIPGIAYINLPKERLDKHMTVVAVLLDKPLELYREDVGAIESNL